MQEDSLMTYEKLYEILRLEKYKKELQKLDVDFLEKVTRYINEKKIILQGFEAKQNMFANDSITKTKRQLENARLLIKELYERREGKIAQMALFNARTNSPLQDADALLEEEKQLYNSLISLFSRFKDGILTNILDGKKIILKAEAIEQKQTNNKLVRFLNAIPKFMGEDMNNYGPFKPEDIANLPEKVAQILLKNNMAEEI